MLIYIKGARKSSFTYLTFRSWSLLFAAGQVPEASSMPKFLDAYDVLKTNAGPMALFALNIKKELNSLLVLRCSVIPLLIKQSL